MSTRTPRVDCDLPTDDVRESRPRILRSLPAPPGARRSRYETGALLGRGGMGAVHSCEDRRVGRTVALKLLARGIGDTAAIERFVDEARLQGRLEHPAIVPVYDLGTTDDGTPFFTMKRVRGVTLAQVLADRRAGTAGSSAGEWSERRLYQALITVCQAVAYAHRCGVVHGDLKPENVMLGRFGEVHVIDWGCASRESAPPDRPERAATDGSALTDVAVLSGLLSEARAAGDLVGTPGYLAPEQAKGERGDRRSDVYALGAILFELVVGRRLHEGANPIARLVSTLDTPQALPSERAPELAIPEQLDQLVWAALAADPARRPSARELAAGVECWLDHELALTGTLRAAEKHAREAAVHASRALASGLETDRESALREAGRALSLDPGNLEACEVLTRLFGVPPATLPTEARAVLDTAEHGLATASIRALAFRAWIWLAMVVPAAALGVRSWPVAALVIAVFAICAWTFTATARARAQDPASRRCVLGLSMLAVACISAVFGPLVMVPVFATTTATIVSIGFGRAERRWALAGAAAAMLVPLGLELVGALPPSMAFEHGALVLLPRLVDLPPIASAVFLGLGSVMAIPMAVMLSGRLRDSVDARLRSLALVEWQLRRALPPALGERLSAALRDARAA